MRMTDWFIIFLFFTRLGLFLAERAFFFSTAFVESRKTAPRFRNRNLSVFLSFLFIPPFSRPETSQQVTPCSSSSAFLSSFHGIARPLSILQRAFFLGGGDSPEERSENRIFLSIEFAYIRLVNGAEYIKSTRVIYIYIIRICKYIYI